MIPTIIVSLVCALKACNATLPVSDLLVQCTYPNPELCTGNCSGVHDPSIVKKDQTYYRFSTGGNIAIATASSLTGPWDYEGALLTQGTSITVGTGQDIWAPDVTLINNVYYAYYSVSIFDTQTSEIGLATSHTLDPGFWTDHGSIDIFRSSLYNLIDPNLLLDPTDSNAAPYLTFGSYWDGIFQATLPNLTDFDSSTGSISLAPLTNLVRNSTSNAKIVEGGFQFAHAGFYYLFFSSGACCNVPPNLAAPGYEYSIMVCRSSQVTGPFTDQQGRSCATGNGGTEVLASHGEVYAPGGQGVMTDNGNIIMYYHYVNTTIGYAADQFLFGFNYLDFSSGWPVVTERQTSPWSRSYTPCDLWEGIKDR